MKRKITEEAMTKEETTRRLIELYETGLTLDQVGKEFGLTRQGVRYRLTAAGITPRRSKYRYLDKTLLKKHYLEDKLSIDKIAETLAVSRNVIKAALEYHNIPKQGRHLQGGYIIDFLKRLEVGGQATLRLHNCKTKYSSVYDVAKRIGIKISTRVCGEDGLLIKRIE